MFFNKALFLHLYLQNIVNITISFDRSSFSLYILYTCRVNSGYLGYFFLVISIAIVPIHLSI